VHLLQHIVSGAEHKAVLVILKNRPQQNILSKNTQQSGISQLLRLSRCCKQVVAGDGNLCCCLDRAEVLVNSRSGPAHRTQIPSHASSDLNSPWPMSFAGALVPSSVDRGLRPGARLAFVFQVILAATTCFHTLDIGC
jgi:hypothetical protein